ncbi:MerR family transcriptional regulator [uncultured Kriegella sp.]|uniref:MerR family transcriptional regulator n=1 Tax=uncultured Kriegella sp. TaxID=1798910 RepID=UPI0030DA5C15|tara:strand:- start:43684 stop:44583 length:900 start_codon:yes stop_codon:yes gene_type:complete
MNNIKTSFSIRDLEHLSGIKAHTIRIWEKRYGLLQPERTDTNIRTYGLASLQKLLNIVYLYNDGYKISKIAKIDEAEIPALVNEIQLSKNSDGHIINEFKLAMMNYDQALFMNTYNTLLSNKDFHTIFYDIFIPLLNEMGLLWQTDTITPAQEHFITALIKQKIITNTEKFQQLEPFKTDKVFVLFLPENEIHDIGLLFINHEIIRRGYQTIFLGPAVPLENLAGLMEHFKNVYFISYFTLQPSMDKIEKYVHDFVRIGNNYNNPNLWILGRQVQFLHKERLPKTISVFTSIEQIVAEI